MKRRIGLLLSMVGVFMLLAGCSSVKEPITADSPHFWDKYVVYPLSELITYVAKLTGDNYGLSIILVTILIRLLILPLMIKQLRSSKAMQALQPEMQKLAFAGASATAREAACANRFPDPMTKVSKVYFGLSIF